MPWHHLRHPCLLFSYFTSCPAVLPHCCTHSCTSIQRDPQELCTRPIRLSGGVKIQPSCATALWSLEGCVLKARPIPCKYSHKHSHVSGSYGQGTAVHTQAAWFWGRNLYGLSNAEPSPWLSHCTIFSHIAWYLLQEEQSRYENVAKWSEDLMISIIRCWDTIFTKIMLLRFLRTHRSLFLVIMLMQKWCEIGCCFTAMLNRILSVPQRILSGDRKKSNTEGNVTFQFSS